MNPPMGDDDGASASGEHENGSPPENSELSGPCAGTASRYDGNHKATHSPTPKLALTAMTMRAAVRRRLDVARGGSVLTVTASHDARAAPIGNGTYALASRRRSSANATSWFALMDAPSSTVTVIPVGR